MLHLLDVIPPGQSTPHPTYTHTHTHHSTRLSLSLLYLTGAIVQTLPLKCETGLDSHPALAHALADPEVVCVPVFMEWSGEES